ncbi:helix-turn-helix domain-containing protein [Nocardia pseudobrasiliensis]|uniref:Helix-turn-helix protein n=1 Tax=Nocardia pseudobrasiliensis TaxID=45979 RepID=A0A370I6F7_9NOCA|nr:helix-turn-helix transcriptional regulator [Nocardia pseudobrasiliensis]RDI66323.1 helix-turn-helix protein [Nocardia pseudobrasiliensis]
MSNDDDDQPSTLAQRELGRFLREKREGMGFTMLQAARLVGLSKTALQRLETARLKRKYRPQDVEALCELYEVSDEETTHAMELVKQARMAMAVSGLYVDAKLITYVGLESTARELISYEEIVPGLLQTPDYARVLISGWFRNDDAENIERRVALRTKRQVLVTRRAMPLKFQVLLHESALHRLIGNKHIMRAQLHHLAEMSKRSNIEIRIVPFSAGCTWGVVPGMFSILDFGVDSRGNRVQPSLVFLEGSGKFDLYVEGDEVKRYYELASAMRETTLDEQQSRDLLRRAARSYER